MLHASNERDVVSVSYAAPRDMLPKESLEYARRSVLRLQNLWMKVDSDAQEFEAMLTELKRAHVARRWPPDQPYGTLKALVLAELGIPLAAARLRFRIAAATTTGDAPLPNGTNRHTLAYSGSNLTRRARAAESDISPATQQRLDLLARKRPDLLREVAAGRMKVRPACILAGFEKERVSVPKEPEAAALALARHFEGHALQRLIAALVAASHP